MEFFDEILKTFDDMCSLLKNLGSATLKFSTTMVYGGKVAHTSIETKTKDITAMFPNIVDRSLSLSNVEKINRCIEVKNSNLLRLLLTSIAKESLNKDSKEILRKFHRNFDDKDFIDFELSEAVVELNNPNLVSSYNISLYENGRKINPVSLNDNFYNYRQNVVIEKSFAEAAKGKGAGTRTINNTIDTQTNHYDNSKTTHNKFDTQSNHYDNSKSTHNKIDSQSNHYDKSFHSHIAHQSNNNSRNNISYNTSNKYDSLTGKPINVSARLTDNDVRIANNLSPLMIEMTIPTNYNGNVALVSVLFGVKSKIYPATQDELIEIISPKKKSRLFRLIQFSTGEIKFFKDLVFNIDHVKDKVGSNADKNNETRVSKLWKILKRRSKNRKSYRFNDMDNASIATLTLSTSTVEELQRVKKMDLLDPKVASKFIEENNIMNLVIVDEVTELVHIMSDADRSFTEITFSFLDKELSDISSQKTLKKSSSYF